MKRLVLYAVAAVVSSPFFAVAAEGTSSAGTPTPSAVANGSFLPAPGHSRVHAARGLIVSQSTNWSGYVQATTTRRTFTEVTDSFVVPTVESSTNGTQFAADWVGIGGFDQHPRDPTLVQTGIQTMVTTSKGHRKVSYNAWTEVLPAAENPLTLTLSVGDTITATVQETAKNTWVMTVDDVTTGQSAGRTVKYRSKGLSAEAIHERPCIMSPCNTVTDLADLAQTSNVTFDPGSFSETPPGTSPVDEPLLTTVAGATLTAVQMLGNDLATPIATPSGPDTADDGFTVADGAAQPPPPTV